MSCLRAPVVGRGGCLPAVPAGPVGSVGLNGTVRLVGRVGLVATDQFCFQVAVLAAESADFLAVGFASCLEFAELGGEPVALVAKFEDVSDAGEVDAFGEQVGDVCDAVDVVSAVPAGAAVGAEGADQASLLDQPRGGKHSGSDCR